MIQDFAVYKKYQNASISAQEQAKEFLSIQEIKPHLTGIVLAGEDKISFRSPQFYFVDAKYYDYADFDQTDDDNMSVSFLTLGDMLSGHDGIVHGGLLATLLDELTCRLAFQNFRSKRGVTANLNISYRKPTYTGTNVAVKCSAFKKQGRKCWVKGSVHAISEDSEDLGELLAECEVLVIEPKWVDELTKKA